MSELILPPAFEEEDFSELTERQMLERLLRENASLRREVASMKQRLQDGDQLFKLAEKREKQHEADWTSAMRFLQNVNLRMARRDPEAFVEADKIEDAINSRFPPNGAAHDTPTNPDNERPSGLPDAE